MDSEHVVIVGRPTDRCEPLSHALEADGWDVRTCAGPARTPCPLLAGKDCALREDAAAAVVYFDPRQKPSAVAPLAQCAASASPAVVVLEGQVDPPRPQADFFIVGSLRGPQVIAGTLGVLLEGFSEPAVP